MLIFFSIDFFKYIPFRAFWFNETVWNISIISAGRGNTKPLVTNCPRCSGVEKLKLLIAKVCKAEQWYNYCSAAYRAINYYGSDATSQNFPRLAINIEVSKSMMQLRSGKGSWLQLKLIQFLSIGFEVLGFSWGTQIVEREDRMTVLSNSGIAITNSC